MTNSRKARIRRQRQRRALLTMALVLVTAFACIGGTIAWLTDETTPVTNTFTVGDINIELWEHEDGDKTKGEVAEESYKMVPGSTLAKDPFVTVKADSEACMVFVKIEELNNLDRFITYGTADGWTVLESASGATTTVIYRTQAATTADTDLYILANDQVTVNNTVTKDDMEDLTDETYPKLKFTAYAIQTANYTGDAAAAWAEVNK